MILVDTNVLLDVITNDPVWADWSRSQLEIAAFQDSLAINEIIYAELSIGYKRIEELDSMLAIAGLSLGPIPRTALFLAGKAFQRYRALRGVKTGVLPDFFIGAHAAIVGIPLLTRDTQRYHFYFPTLTLISPDTN